MSKKEKSALLDALGKIPRAPRDPHTPTRVSYQLGFAPGSYQITLAEKVEFFGPRKLLVTPPTIPIDLRVNGKVIAVGTDFDRWLIERDAKKALFDMSCLKSLRGGDVIEIAGVEYAMLYGPAQMKPEAENIHCQPGRM